MLRLAIARAEEDFDEMEKLQKDIEKINREINLSKVGRESFYPWNSYSFTGALHKKLREPQ